MGFKQFTKDYLTFSKKDRIGILSILGLILIIYCLPVFFAKQSTTSFIKEDTLLQHSIDSFQQKPSVRNTHMAYEAPPAYYPEKSLGSNTVSIKSELFQFDPNTLNAEGWSRLGLNDRVIRTINNYRTKGGKFYKPEDLQKIWGLPQGFYDRVKDYITLKSINNYPTAMAKPENYTPYSKKPKEKLSIIDINKADTATLIALPGIGSKLSARLINFREKLGGFYSVDQVAETYGLPDSTFQHIKGYLTADAHAVKKLNINTATKEELKMHPYIKWNLANAIVEYRNQHGSFKSLEELKNIALIDEATFNKISNYLSL